MALSDEIRSASSEAQSNLAQIQGMAQGADGNFVYNGQAGIGVFGAAQIAELPQAGGGYRRRGEVPLVVTRDQDFNFIPKTKITRLANSEGFPAITYVIDRIDPHGPFFWKITLVRTGE